MAPALSSPGMVLAVAAVLLWTPGTLLGRALGLRRRWALVAAPALTWGVVTLAATAVPHAGLAWGPWTALGSTAVAVLLAVALTLLSALSALSPFPGPRRRRRDSRAADLRERSGAGAWLAGAAGCAVAAAVVVAVAWRARHRLGATAQTWDAVYHANLTAFIARTGDSDPVSAPSALAGAGWRTVDTYYPDALHAFAALVVRLVGAEAAGVLDALAVLVGAAVLPTAAAALAATAAPARRGTAAAVAAAVSVLPVAGAVDLWWRGLWGYGASLATAVLVAALAVRALRGRLVPGRPVAAAAAVGTGAVGVAGLQPAGAVLAGVLVLAWGLGRLATAALAPPPAERPADRPADRPAERPADRPADRPAERPAERPGRRSQRRLLAGLAAAAVGTALLPVVVHALARWSPSLGSLEGYDYTTRPGTPLGVASAVGSVLGAVRQVSPGYGYAVPQQDGQWLLVGVVVTAAVLVAASRGTWWLAAAWGFLVLAAASTVAPVEAVLTPAVAAALRAFTLFSYGAPFRLMAVAAVLGAVVVGVGAARVGEVLGRRAHPPRPPGAVAALVATGLLVSLLVGIAAGTLQRAPVRLAAGYAPRVTGPDQLAVMDRLAEHLREHPLPAGATVANDPVDGSAWLYARDGVPVLFRHYSTGTVTPQVRLLLERLDDVDTEPAVQQALRELRVCYVYASDTPVQDFQRLAPGFADLDAAAWLQPVAREGGAAAYRVLVPGTPCAG